MPQWIQGMQNGDVQVHLLPVLFHSEMFETRASKGKQQLLKHVKRSKI